jgi:hypothetical protein
MDTPQIVRDPVEDGMRRLLAAVAETQEQHALAAREAAGEGAPPPAAGACHGHGWRAFAQRLRT